MPLPVIADTIRVAVQGLMSNGHPWANILHYRKTGALTFPAAITLLDPIILDHWTTNNGAGIGWFQFAPTTASLSQVVYTPLDGTSASSVVGHVFAGTSGQDALPANVALVVTLRTALRGRSHRGRVYQAPWPETMNTATGTPLAANVASVLAQWNAHITALVGTGLSLVVASYLLSTATDVASITVDARWDSQRRRLNP